ncbi:hypothetical protein EMPS_06748 [Entomortierella parvispora]|uniref:Uncharacterized protein n=1 Tax=Entomortierella parvispora TaxID=205924 RepID=A0A9P3HD73_9FUNG|nr:hypothetical protein EMPS_06748 [Entomortierella parvispora]
MDGRLSDDPTGRVFAWQKLSQAELDQIAHDSRKQRQVRLMQDPPKCSYCPKARFTSLTMYTTHCQSKAHRIRVREFQKIQRRALHNNTLKHTSIDIHDSSSRDGQTSGDSFNDVGARIPIRMDIVKEADSAEIGKCSSGSDLNGPLRETGPDSGRLLVKKVGAVSEEKARDSQGRNLNVASTSAKNNPRCPLCRGSTLRKQSFKSHILSAKHMKAVYKLMQTWSGPIPPTNEMDVLSAMDQYCWGAAVGAEEEHDEEAEEEERVSDVLPGSPEGEAYDILSAQEVDMDLSE